MNTAKYVELYLSKDKNLTILRPNKKLPRLKGWNNTVLSREDLLKHTGNFAWVLGDEDLVIDIDPRKGGYESFKKLCQDFNLSLNYSVKTPGDGINGNGFHIYLKKPIGLKIKKTSKYYKGIDFLHKGNFCLIAGCVTKIGVYILEDIEFNQVDCPSNLLDFLSFKKDKSKNESGSFDNTFGFKQSYVTVEKLVNSLNPDCEYDTWIKIGMALHNWDNKHGFNIWDSWSVKGLKYDNNKITYYWDNFCNTKDNKVTLGTVYYLFDDKTITERHELVEAFLNEISVATEKDIELNILRQINKNKFNDIDKERLAKAIQIRLKELTKVITPIDKIRKLIKHEVTERDTPEWCKKYVYLLSSKCFIDIDNDISYSAEAFKIENNHHIINDDTIEKKIDAVKFISNNHFIPTVVNEVYLPNCTDKIITVNNKQVLNTFNSNSIPKEAKQLTEEGKKYIEFFKQHIKYLVGEDNYENFVYWMAHQVQFMGKKLQYAPIIKSFEGMGKGTVGEILTGCLGDKNVGVVFPDTIADKYTSWATNVSLNILNEIKISGNNRYDILNKLKPIITDPTLDIRKIYSANYTCKNVTNYLCFTNFNLAIPLSTGDRRWWVIYCPVDSKEELESVSGMSYTEYFKKFEIIRKKYIPEIRKWLIDLQIPQSFLDINTAPHTLAKELMIATEDDSHEGLDEIRELLEKGDHGIHKDCFCAKLFAEAINKNLEFDFNLNTTKRHLLFKRLGYSKYPKQFKWDGEVYWVWVKKALSTDKIREVLNSTKK